MASMEEIEKIKKEIDDFQMQLKEDLNHRKIHRFVKSSFLATITFPFLGAAFLYSQQPDVSSNPFINRLKPKKVEISQDETEIKTILNKEETSAIIEYSDGWTMNEEGSYERSISRYQYNGVNGELTPGYSYYFTAESIEEVLEQQFTLLSQEIQVKEVLEKSDSVYQEPTITLPKLEVKQTDNVHTAVVLNYISKSIFLGVLFCVYEWSIVFLPFSLLIEKVRKNYPTLNRKSRNLLKKELEEKKQTLELMLVEEEIMEQVRTLSKKKEF